MEQEFPGRNGVEDVKAEPWYLVQTRPNSLHRAERNLLRQGFGVFSPKIRRTVKGRHHFSVVIKPLFPGYVFVQTHQDPLAWRAINSTFGVSRLVSFGNSFPKAVPDAFIRATRDRCDCSGIIQPERDLASGDVVRVLKGPFSDFMLTIDRLDDRQRVWVLLDILGKETSVSFPKEDLLRVSRHKADV